MPVKLILFVHVVCPIEVVENIENQNFGQIMAHFSIIQSQIRFFEAGRGIGQRKSQDNCLQGRNILCFHMTEVSFLKISQATSWR